MNVMTNHYPIDRPDFALQGKKGCIRSEYGVHTVKIIDVLRKGRMKAEIISSSIDTEVPDGLYLTGVLSNNIIDIEWDNLVSIF